MPWRGPWNPWSFIMELKSRRLIRARCLLLHAKRSQFTAKERVVKKMRLEARPTDSWATFKLYCVRRWRLLLALYDFTLAAALLPSFFPRLAARTKRDWSDSWVTFAAHDKSECLESEEKQRKERRRREKELKKRGTPDKSECLKSEKKQRKERRRRGEKEQETRSRPAEDYASEQTDK